MISGRFHSNRQVENLPGTSPFQDIDWETEVTKSNPYYRPQIQLQNLRSNFENFDQRKNWVGEDFFQLARLKYFGIILSHFQEGAFYEFYVRFLNFHSKISHDISKIRRTIRFVNWISKLGFHDREGSISQKFQM